MSENVPQQPNEVRDELMAKRAWLSLEIRGKRARAKLLTDDADALERLSEELLLQIRAGAPSVTDRS